MRFQRLLLEAGSATVTIDLHPRLTVIAGVGDLERQSLVNELFAGLAGSRPGTHVEIAHDSGRRLGVMHPSNGVRDRVVEMATGEDVTNEFLTPDGTIDVLGRLGFDLGGAKRRCSMSSRDMATDAALDNAVTTLAMRDQGRLWATAEALRVSDAVLKSEVAAIGGNPDDAPLVEEVERRHAAFEAAQERLEYVRHHGIFVGGASVLAAMPAAALRHWASIPLVVVAIVTTALSIFYRRRMEKARKQERLALDRAGADTYLSFRLQQMNTMFDGGADRTRLGMAVAEHREALAAWQALAGEISVDLAFDLRERVTAAAQRIRSVGNAASASAAAAEPAELAQALIVRMSELRHAGARGESMPLLLDEPLAGVATSVKQWLLELIARSAGSPQIIYLTEDPEIASWARMESVGGELAILEPAATQERDDLRL